VLRAELVDLGVLDVLLVVVDHLAGDALVDRDELGELGARRLIEGHHVVAALLRDDLGACDVSEENGARDGERPGDRLALPRYATLPSFCAGPFADRGLDWPIRPNLVKLKTLGQVGAGL
jgi:hypothetical protein